MSGASIRLRKDDLQTVISIPCRLATNIQIVVARGFAFKPYVAVKGIDPSSIRLHMDHCRRRTSNHQSHYTFIFTSLVWEVDQSLKRSDLKDIVTPT